MEDITYWCVFSPNDLMYFESISIIAADSIELFTYKYGLEWDDYLKDGFTIKKVNITPVK